MTELVEKVLSSPIIRAFIQGLVIKVLAEILHRRNVSPEFRAKSDEVFSRMANAETQEEYDESQEALRRLMSGN